MLRDGLSKNFVEVEVDFRETPDLSKEPFNLAASGLCGRSRICDVGGPNNTFPVLLSDKVLLFLQKTFTTDTSFEGHNYSTLCAPWVCDSRWMHDTWCTE